MSCNESKFREYVRLHFGIEIPKDYWIEEHKNKVYIYKIELKDIDFHGISRKGMLVGKLKTLYGIKPSLDFIIKFGELATKNYIEVNDGEIEKIYRGEVIKNRFGKEGLIILRKGKENIGIAMAFKNNIKGLIKKNRLIKENI